MSGASTRMRDHRDDVITILADAERDLLEQVVDLTLERDAWRELARASIYKNHDQQRGLDSLRYQLARLRNEYRDLRAHTMRAEVAA